MTSSAGKRLRDEMAAALAATSADVGQELAFTERELLVIAEAADCADHAEILKRRWRVEADKGDDADVGVLVKLAAEARLQGAQAMSLIGKIQLDPPAPKSSAHVKAARSRWDRRLA